jgi:hypothetical protein
VKPRDPRDLQTPRDLLVAIIDQAYNRTSWHGTNLRGSIRRVGVEQAVWRPKPNRHNIWEIVVHAAYWKYAAARRFTSPLDCRSGRPEQRRGTGARGAFRLKGSNWFRRPLDRANATERAWREDVALLDETHDTLREAVARLSPEDLTRTPHGKKVSNFALLSGIAAHDLYHAGQVQLLKRLSSL